MLLGEKEPVPVLLHIPPEAACTDPLNGIEKGELLLHSILSAPALAKIVDGKSVTITVSKAIGQLVASSIITEYVPAVAATMLCVVAPVFHQKV